MAGTLTKLAGVELATVMGRATLPPEAQVPLRGCADIADAIVRLEAAGFAADAVRMLAHALPCPGIRRFAHDASPGFREP